MGYWQTRGLRGNELEEIINITNDMYRSKKMALIQKIPTPITPINIDKAKKVITLAYFEQKSTVDYIGVVQSVSVCFDAKETTKKSIPLANIHQHQIDFMEDFIAQGGVAFIIVYFKHYETYFLLPFNVLKKYHDGAKNGERKSIPYDAFEDAYKIEIEGGHYLHYLKPLQKYVDDIV
ncbi:MAG: Holliday junction resolvase RecU [Epulopiscium sp. Nele67-Bin004]|nr:MAG: Holliday junction resolvase RecU [Epulopiscium sp. Nele67-Bin004]